MREWSPSGQAESRSNVARRRAFVGACAIERKLPSFSLRRCPIVADDIAAAPSRILAR
jgi:hypothetical protein